MLSNIELYPKMAEGIVPSEDSSLGVMLRENPSLLVADADVGFPASRYSIIAMMLQNGSLSVTDFILKQDGAYVPNANPFY